MAPGTVNVTVTDSLGTSPAFSYTYSAAPYVLDATTIYAGDNVPTVSGPASGGTTVTVRGINLSDATAVNFGNTAVTSFTYYGSTTPGDDYGELAVVSPSGIAGTTVDVTVTTPEGTSSGARDNSGTFTYKAPPTVSGISPASGPLAGGNSVTITGTGLFDVKEVDFGSVAVAVNGGYSDTAIEVGVPAGLALGTVDVTVIDLGGNVSPISTADEYTYQPPPTVTGLSVPSGSTLPPAHGRWHARTITGTGLAGATVAFGVNNAFQILSDTDNQITVLSPLSQADGPGHLRRHGDDLRRHVGHVFRRSVHLHECAFISSVTSYHEISNGTQAAGTTAGGETVTINGYDLDSATAVDFGGTPAASFIV